VILREFSLRVGSGGPGGSGGQIGGDGVVRRIQFRRDGMTMSLLSERRSRPPPGLCGGGSAAQGLNLLRRSDGVDINVGAKARLLVHRGDTISINTPGGHLASRIVLLCVHSSSHLTFVIFRRRGLWHRAAIVPATTVAGG
jgi:5-oxoprolinase (ATP-hydrolysing)